MSSKTKLTSIAYHRNGITGEGFYVVLFKWTEGRTTWNMIATAFLNDAAHDNGRIAILDVDMAAAGNITFGQNSWRHETFADDIVKWVNEFRVVRGMQLVQSALPATSP